MYDFKQVAIDKHSLLVYSELLSQVFTSTNKFSPQFIEWEYKDNPNGNIIGFNAHYEGKLAAHYVTQPVQAVIDGKVRKGLLSLNTATHPEHQGKKLFTTLAEKTYGLAYNEGYEFVYGVANANSTPGFLKKLGFQLIAPLDAKIGLGQLKKKNDEDNYSFRRSWNNDELFWRLNNPSQGYTIKKEQVIVPSGKIGLNAILGMFEKEQLRKVEIQNNLSKFGIANLYVGLDNSINWKKSLYFDVPNKFKSSPLNLIFKDLTGKGMKMEKETVKFQVIDFDGY